MKILNCKGKEIQMYFLLDECDNMKTINENDLKEILGKIKYLKFLKFICGETYIKDNNGIYYFLYDVEEFFDYLFIKHKINRNESRKLMDKIVSKSCEM